MLSTPKWGERAGHLKDVESSIRARFADAVVRTEPYPHLVIENILPGDLYPAIERDIPHGAKWCDSAIRSTFMRRLTEARQKYPNHRWSLVPGSVARTVGSWLPGSPRDEIAQPAIDCVQPARCTYGMHGVSLKWQAKYAESIKLVNTLVEQMFEPHTSRYLDELVAAGIFKTRPAQKPLVHEFCRRVRGWTIGPHTHDIGQSIQWMIYFPLPGSDERQGTLFYRLRQPKTIAAAKLRGSIWFDSSEVEYYFSVPYRPNTLIAFLNTPYAVHATLKTSPIARRYFFGCNWWADEPALLDIQVTPDGIKAA
jgi:hypothetical protein